MMDKYIEEVFLEIIKVLALGAILRIGIEINVVENKYLFPIVFNI